jgi:hypothetical protein
MLEQQYVQLEDHSNINESLVPYTTVAKYLATVVQGTTD